MVSAVESKAALAVIAGDSVDTVRWMLRRTSGRWESRRLQLLDTVPGVVGFYSEGSAALAVDFYDDERARVPEKARYAAAPVILDRTVRIRRGVAWASEPLSVDDDELASERLAEVMQSEVVRPYRDTILENRKRDPACVGWKRITSSGACAFCRALADRGAVYREVTANFSAHTHCMCTCAPVFRGGAVGPEASLMQYIASGKRRTQKQKDQIYAWVAGYEDETSPRKHIKVSH